MFRQLMVTYAEVSELLMARQSTKSVNYRKDLTQLLSTNLLRCFSLLKHMKSQKTRGCLLRKQEIYTKILLCSLQEVN